MVCSIDWSFWGLDFCSSSINALSYDFFQECSSKKKPAFYTLGDVLNYNFRVPAFTYFNLLLGSIYVETLPDGRFNFGFKYSTTFRLIPTSISKTRPLKSFNQSFFILSLVLLLRDPKISPLSLYRP